MARMWRSKKALHCWPMWTRTSPLQHPSNVGSAAVDGGVADVLALDDVDDVFGDVGGVIADAFEVFSHEDKLESGKDHAGIAHHVSKQFAENLIAIVIHLVVGGEDLVREVDVATHDGVQSVAHHFLDEIAHARQIHIGFHARMAQDAQRALGDIHGLVTDALEVVVDAGNRENKAKIDSHQLMQREELNDTVVNFKLQLVDGVFLLEDTLGERLIGFEHRVNSLM